MFRWICAFLCFCMALSSEEAKISAEVDPYAAVDAPIKTTVSIVRSKKDLVDVESFRLGNEPIKLEFVKEVEFSVNSDTVLSIYQFSLPAQKTGLYILPEIHANVGGQSYSSHATTYAIGELSSPPSTTKSPTTKPPSPRSTSIVKPTVANDRIPIILKLESIVEGDQNLYLGQSITVGYRFIFNFNVDLNKEDLPLIKGDGFEKVGAKDTKFYIKDEMNVLEVRQTLKAIKLGTYKFPEGAVQGRAYRMIGERKENAEQDSKAASAPVELVVRPFPEEAKPPSFNGAIGKNLNFKLRLLSSSEMSVGDKMDLLIEITGEGELLEMPMPEICCQPGFSGFFGMSDLPPIEKLDGNTKTFKVEMRPLNRSIRQIPPLEFSYFNPKTRTYKTLKSVSIPIKVKPIRQEEEILDSEAVVPYQKPQEVSKEKFIPEPLEVGANEPLNSSDLKNLFLGSWWTLLIAPGLIGLFIIQLQWKSFLIKWRQRPKIETSRSLMEKAIENPVDTPEFFNGIEKALLRKLLEEGEISSEKVASELLSPKGRQGEVRALLREIEEKRFSPDKQSMDENFIARVKRFFDDK